MKPAKQKKHPDAMREKEDVQRNPDKHIDQDFEGYPHHPAKDEIVKPQTKVQKKVAGVHSKTKTSQ